jgi:hypothetical protein
MFGALNPEELARFRETSGLILTVPEPAGGWKRRVTR